MPRRRTSELGKLERIHQVALFARDLDEAIGFYRETLGMDYLGRFDPPGLAFVEVGGVRLLLGKDAPKSTVYFHVEDIDSAYRELAARGVKFITGPQLVHSDDAGVFGHPGGEERMAFFADPSGNTLAIASRKPVSGAPP